MLAVSMHTLIPSVNNSEEYGAHPTGEENERWVFWHHTLTEWYRWNSSPCWQQRCLRGWTTVCPSLPQHSHPLRMLSQKPSSQWYLGFLLWGIWMSTLPQAPPNTSLFPTGIGTRIWHLERKTRASVVSLSSLSATEGCSPLMSPRWPRVFAARQGIVTQERQNVTGSQDWHLSPVHLRVLLTSAEPRPRMLPHLLYCCSSEPWSDFYFSLFGFCPQSLY